MRRFSRCVWHLRWCPRVGLIGPTSIVLLLFSASARAGITTLESLPESTSAIPPVGSVYYQPTFGTRSYRMFDAKAAGYTKLVPEYSNLQAWNADLTKILLRKNDGWIICDARPPFRVIRSNIAPGAQANRWSPTDPDLIYHLKDGDNRIYKYSVSRNMDVVVHQFGEYDQFSRDESLQEMSEDGRWIGLAAGRAGHGDGTYDSLEVFAYDVMSNVKSPVIKRSNVFSSAPRSTAYGLNWVMVSPSGTYLLILWTGTGSTCRFTGAEAYTRSDGIYRGKVSLATGHGDIFRDRNGTEWLVQDWANYPGPFSGHPLVKSRIPDGIKMVAGATTCEAPCVDVDSVADWTASTQEGRIVQLLSLATGSPQYAYGTHTSCRARWLQSGGDTCDYCVVSADVQLNPIPSWPAFQGEVWRVWISSRVGAEAVERLAHHRSRIQRFASDGCDSLDTTDREYWAQPHASLSPDGRKVIYGTNWHRVCIPSQYAQSYLDPVMLEMAPPQPLQRSP